LSEKPDGEDSEPTPGPNTGVDDCRDGIELFFKEHHESLVQFLRTILSSADEAQEVAQDAYLQILKRGGVRTPKHLQYLLFRTAIHRALDRLRRRRHREKYAVWSRQQGEAVFQSTDGQVLARDSLQRLKGFLEELPDAYRDVFLMYRIQKLPRKEVARRLSVTTRTVSRYVDLSVAYLVHRLDGHPVAEAKELVGL
jgi:RNA polymerase sigma factor (sigma-70 family)